MSGIKQEIAALKRQRILEAAVEVFYEQGYEKATLDDVARKLDVTKPFIYSYYNSKATLLAAICVRSIEESLRQIDAVLVADLDPVGSLRLLGKLFTRVVLGNQRYMAIFAREEKNLNEADFKRISDMRREFDRKLNVLLQRGMDDGVFNIPDRQIAALAIGGLVSWSYVWYRENQRLSADKISDLMTDLILNLVHTR
ncbi:TetR/AcrR family transcriptional regulator [Mesorhizobium sp. ANAO-SY3R2]|uniref:TetR/AcrR family transcriptional regulator n=1 Tax=Mesorhizobium sp. ANAO-SY3R2 TaxID=3166644 RepID=UPI003670FC9D